MKNFSMKVSYKSILLISLSLLLSACQLTSSEIDNKQQTTVVSYSDYYLWLKSFSSTELLLEIKQLKSQLSANDNTIENNVQLESKLLLIYSLPNPAVYQPFKAKALLNKYPLPINTSNETDENLAFMVMLRDQLNSQLHLLSKQEKLETSYLAEQAKKQAEIMLLKKQLAQLKAIEKNISGHGLVN